VTLPDGTGQLTRPRRARTKNVAGWLVITLVFAWLVIVGLGRATRPIPFEGGGEMPGWLLPAFFLVFEAIALGMLLWSAIGREEWLLGPNHLEVRRSIAGKMWTRPYADAALEVTASLQPARPVA